MKPTVISGESRVFRALDGVKLLHPYQQIISVYSFDKNGEKIDYRLGQDWIATDGLIVRTADSRIPDLSNYKYSTSTACSLRFFSLACVRSLFQCGTRNGPCWRYADDDPIKNSFQFSADPRNPPLTIEYNVYVDYISLQRERMVPARALLTKNNLNVICIGDSIAAGSHTIGNFHFQRDSESWCGLLRSHLGGRSAVHNEAVPSGELKPLKGNLPRYLANRPDIVIIAFGMNDHLAGAAGLPAFSAALNEVVGKLLTNNVKVILVGFFQQNKLWIREDPSQSVAYNTAIEAIASKHAVPFIDIYKAFQRATPGFEPYHHLTADFMHHPTSYGQRIYFSMLVPYFLHRDTAASNIAGYVIGDW